MPNMPIVSLIEYILISLKSEEKFRGTSSR